MFRLRFDPYVLVLLALSAIAVAPLTAPGYFMFAHDARHTVYFMQMFDAALREGALYPRWATDMTFGYGYPVWIILAPLPYYLIELFHLTGLDFPTAIKAAEAVGLVGSGLTMYLFARRVLGREAGLLAGAVFLFVPYHIVDLYVRGAGPEFLAFLFPPFILWAIHGYMTTRRAVYVPFIALGYGALVLTHAQMAVLFSPLIGGYILMLWAFYARAALSAGRRSALAFFAMPALGIIWGVLLSFTFLLPVLLEQRYLTTDPLIGGFFNFRQHFISIAQLLSPFWGYGYAGINGGDQFSLQLGIAPLFLAVVALFGLGERKGDLRVHLLFFALAALAAILVMLPVSASIWDLAAPVVAFVQFPWRLLVITAVALSFLAGAAIHLLPREDAPRAALVLSLLVVVALFPNTQPQYTEATFNYTTLMDFEVTSRELLGDTIWMEPGKRPQDSPLVEQYRAGKITEKAVIAQGSGQVELLAHRFLSDEVRVTADQAVLVMFYTRYFPGWTATIDGQPTPIEPYGEQGLVAVSVPAGLHTVRTQFGDTWDRQVGAGVSFLAFISVLAWLWRTRQG
ncbi:MAG: hypothetical protein WCF84_02840 [Anaerolineae bacterium]